MIRFDPILPKPFNQFGFESAIRSEVAKTVDFIKGDFEATTATWNTRVLFQRTYANTPDEISGGVHTTNRVYCWVSLGTKKDYPIVPRRAKLLRYQEQFTPKTTKGVVGSQSGGKFGNYTERLSVIHPGIDARGFGPAIRDHRKKFFVNSIRSAMSEGVKRSGHRL